MMIFLTISFITPMQHYKIRIEVSSVKEIAMRSTLTQTLVKQKIKEMRENTGLILE